MLAAEDSLAGNDGFGDVHELHAQLGRTAAALAALDEVVEVVTDVWQQPWFLARLRVSAIGLQILAATVAALSEADRAAAVERGAVFYADGLATLEQGVIDRITLGPEGQAWLGRLHAEGADLAAARASLQAALLRIRVAERRHREGPRRRG